MFLFYSNIVFLYSCICTIRIRHLWNVNAKLIWPNWFFIVCEYASLRLDDDNEEWNVREIKLKERGSIMMNLWQKGECTITTLLKDLTLNIGVRSLSIVVISLSPCEYVLHVLNLFHSRQTFNPLQIKSSLREIFYTYWKVLGLSISHSPSHLTGMLLCG